MKRNLFFRVFVFSIFFILHGCREEMDWKTRKSENDRALEFFKNQTDNSRNVNSSLISASMQQLKELNNKTNFVNKISDKKGIPAWNYLVKTTGHKHDHGNPFNKGEESSEEILIIPLRIVDNFLSSLMYVENPTSENPIVYTVTNEELRNFTNNTSIDSHIREKILMTFIYFDNSMFGSRLYSSIPMDLFENVTVKEGKQQKSFAVSAGGGDVGNTAPEICFTVQHCKNNEPDYLCDHCALCTSQICFQVGGGYDGGGSGDSGDPGDNPYNPTDPTNSGGGGSGGGQTNPNIPWYLQNPDIDVFSYSPIAQSIFQSLTDQGYVLGAIHMNFLQQNSQIAMKFRNYLIDNTLAKSQFTIFGINYFIDNPGTTWQQFQNFIPKTPCEKIATIGKNSKTKDLFGLLKPKTNSTKESGYILTENNETISETYIEGNTGEHSINFSVDNPIDGFIHSHYIGLLSVFSVSDMFALAQLYKKGKVKDVNTFVIGVVTASNTQYLMVIDDPAKFGAFANNLFDGNEIDETVQNLYEFVYAGFGIKTNNTAMNNESSFVSYLQTNKTGLKLLKGDSSFSNWSVLNKDPNGNVVPQNCP